MRGKLEALQAENEQLRGQRDAAQRERDAMYRFLDAPAIAITYLLRDGTIHMVNTRGAHNLGSDPDTLVGQNIFDLIPALADQTRVRIAQALDEGQEAQFETMIDLPVGRRWFRSTYFCVQVAPGQPEMVQLVSQDITELKQAEQALEATEGRLSTILEHAPQLIAILDRDTVIRYLNRVPEGYVLEQVVGTPVGQQLPALHVPGFVRAFEAVLQTANPQLIEIEDLAGHRQEVRLAPIMENGEVRQVLGFVADVTDRHKARARERELEAQVLHAQKVESLGVLAGRRSLVCPQHKITY